MRFDFCVELIASFYFFLPRSKLLPLTNNKKKKNDIGTKTYQTKHIAFHQFKSGIFLLQQPQLITVKTVKCELMKLKFYELIKKKRRGKWIWWWWHFWGQCTFVKSILIFSLKWKFLFFCSRCLSAVCIWLISKTKDVRSLNRSILQLNRFECFIPQMFQHFTVYSQINWFRNQEREMYAYTKSVSAKKRHPKCEIYRY